MGFPCIIFMSHVGVSVSVRVRVFLGLGGIFLEFGPSGGRVCGVSFLSPLGFLLLLFLLFFALRNLLG